MKKKITFIVNHAAFFCSHRLPVAERIISKGWDFNLIIGQAGDILMEREAVEILKKKKITFQRTYFSPKFSKNFLKEIFSIFQIISILLFKRPDIVHLVSPKAILFGGLACKLLFIKKKIFAISGMGYFYTGENNFKKTLLRKIYFFLFKIIFLGKHSQIIVQNSSDLLEIKKNLKINNNKKFILIPGSGVDEQIFKFSNFLKRKKIILLTARILFDKGIVEFFNSAKILKRKYKNWEFIIAGSDNYNSPSSIGKEKFKRLLKENNIKWLGYQSDMRKLINECSIFCLPSYREGMSKSLIEAAMSGLPIVTTNVPGCKEIVKNNINGYLVTAKNSKMLSIALEKLILSKKKRFIFSIQSRLHAKKNFSLINVVNKTIDIYKKI